VNIGLTEFVCIPHKVKVILRAVMIVWNMAGGVRMA
jgi:hypothetical protein